MYVALERCSISIVFPVNSITLFPSISYTSISYCLSEFKTTSDVVGLGNNLIWLGNSTLVEEREVSVIKLCSVITTIIVSIYPAAKAASLDTVKTLKYE